MTMIEQSVALYREIRRRLCEVEPEIDDETLADTLEGLTDLHEILAAAVRAARTDEAMAAGLRELVKSMQARQTRLEDRAQLRRRLVRDVMVENDLKKITAPDATLSLRPGTPGVVVIDEGVIPAPYWEPREPRLNRQDLLADLKAGAVIAGAALSNPEPVLSVRVR
jgi:hypothetical protein